MPSGLKAPESELKLIPPQGISRRLPKCGKEAFQAAFQSRGSNLAY